MRYVVKHSLADGRVELGLEEFPNNQECDTAVHARTYISKPYHSPSMPEAHTYDRSERYILARVMHKKSKIPAIEEISARIRNLYKNEVAGTIASSSGSEAVSLTAYRTSLSGEFHDNVGMGMVLPHFLQCVIK